MNFKPFVRIKFYEVILVKKCIIFAVAVFFSMFLCGVMMGANEPQQTVNVSAYVLMEAGTHTVLESENSDKQLNSGYLSKLMSVLLFAEDIETGKYKLETEITAPEAVYGTKGSVVWLQAGDKMSVDELLKSVIIGNANDAVTALVYASEQSVEDFTKRMNKRAFELGLRNTAFYSPYGYYDEREFTTAADMAVICSELSEYEFLETYFRTWRDFVKEGATELVSENTLTRTFDKHCGFKACHSEETGYCIAEGGRSENGTVYVAVVLGGADEETAFSTAKSLVRKGFSEYKVTEANFPQEMMKPLSVRNGTESAVEIAFEGMSDIVVPKGVKSLTTVSVIPQYADAPVKKGQRLGTAAFYSNDTLVYETYIVSQKAVPRLTFNYIFSGILSKVLE